MFDLREGYILKGYLSAAIHEMSVVLTLLTFLCNCTH